MWRHGPWLVGLFLAPLLFGSVTVEGKVVTGALLALSVWFVTDVRRKTISLIPRPAKWVLACLLLFPLVPLPHTIVSRVNPERADLADRIPLERTGADSQSDWIPATLSPASTIDRLFEIVLLVFGFTLARQLAGSGPGACRILARTIALTLWCLALADLWFQLDGKRTILGLWTPSWGEAAGTFANRNHFAGWVYAGALVCLGSLARGWLSARRSSHPRSSGFRMRTGKLEWCFVAGAVVFALTMAVRSASRGGALAFAAGLCVWLVGLWFYGRNRRVPIAGLFGGIGVLVLLLVFSEPLLGRFASLQYMAESDYPKLDIWSDSVALFLRFPVFGIGPGSFETAFGHFKSFGGDLTFLHAENDYLETLVELGGAGFLALMICFGMAVCALGRGLLRRDRIEEPELMIGLAAGFAALCVHASVEFVYQIPSLALLGAVVAGSLAGYHDRRTVSAGSVVPLPPKSSEAMAWRAAAAMVVAACAFQGTAFIRHQIGLRQLENGHPGPATENMAMAMRWWPWAVDRQGVLTRHRIRSIQSSAEPDRASLAASARREVNRVLARDPFDWRLRLERSWLDLAFGTERSRAIEEAWDVVRLNPLQPAIPIEFAAFVVEFDRAEAWRFLSAGSPGSRRDLTRMLEIGWVACRQQPGDLWSLVPAGDTNLETLGDFALSRELRPLAATAFRAVSAAADPVRVARRLNDAGRPDLALERLDDLLTIGPGGVPRREPSAPRSTGLIWEAQALAASLHREIGGCARAMTLAERVCRQALPSVPATVGPWSFEAFRSAWEAGDRSGARRLALGAVSGLPLSASELDRIIAFADAHPGEAEVQWLAYHAQLRRDDFAGACRRVVRLAESLAAGQSNTGPGF